MGKVFKYGDNVDTDVIVPGKYLSLSQPEDLKKVCMEGCDKDFSSEVCIGDVMVAGKNFGCGSSREHAPISLRASGLSCIIAKSFARIFFRNAINLGLTVLESDEASEGISAGDEVEVHLDEGRIENKTNGESYSFIPYPAEIMTILESGGVKKKMQNANE